MKKGLNYFSEGEEYAKRAIDHLGCVEVHNGAMRGVIDVLENTGLSILSKSKYYRALKTFDLPKEFYPRKPRLLSAGSDAHSPDCLGAGVQFKGRWKSRNEAFKKISGAHGKVIKQKACHPYRDMFTTLSEWWMKKCCRGV